MVPPAEREATWAPPPTSMATTVLRDPDPVHMGLPDSYPPPSMMPAPQQPRPPQFCPSAGCTSDFHTRTGRASSCCCCCRPGGSAYLGAPNDAGGTLSDGVRASPAAEACERVLHALRAASLPPPPLLSLDSRLRVRRGIGRRVRRRDACALRRCSIFLFRLASVLAPTAIRHRTSASCLIGCGTRRWQRVERARVRSPTTQRRALPLFLRIAHPPISHRVRAAASHRLPAQYRQGCLHLRRRPLLTADTPPTDPCVTRWRRQMRALRAPVAAPRDSLRWRHPRGLHRFRFCRRAIGAARRCARRLSRLLSSPHHSRPRHRARRCLHHLLHPRCRQGPSASSRRLPHSSRQVAPLVLMVRSTRLAVAARPSGCHSRIRACLLRWLVLVCARARRIRRATGASLSRFTSRHRSSARPCRPQPPCRHPMPLLSRRIRHPPCPFRTRSLAPFSTYRARVCRRRTTTMVTKAEFREIQSARGQGKDLVFASAGAPSGLGGAGVSEDRRRLMSVLLTDAELESLQAARGDVQ